jgi:hypothetical protein
MSPIEHPVSSAPDADGEGGDQRRSEKKLADPARAGEQRRSGLLRISLSAIAVIPELHAMPLEPLMLDLLGSRRQFLTIPAPTLSLKVL